MPDPEVGIQGSQSATPASKAAYEQEIRLAVVMYGGVSLAIYINGVAQELLRLVRATAPATDVAADDLLIPDQELSDVERVYRELGCRLGFNTEASPDPGNAIRTRFIVDVLSGTSAGGINGVFLSCALARLETMKDLKELWINEGDLAKLLNDARSVGDLDGQLKAQKPPLSLLNSRRMYLKLHEALRRMKSTRMKQAVVNPKNDEVTNSPLVDELDLFVTTTDLRGLVIKLRLADKLVYERRYRNVFHFKHVAGAGSEPAEDAGGRDLVHDNDPFLAYAARCTSSFPVAFEPMTLGQAESTIGPFDESGPEKPASRWKKFYRSYADPRENPVRKLDTPTGPFKERPFGDGGYLDNKPFSYALEALRGRNSAMPMQRKLFYIEPSPDHPELDRNQVEVPDAIENLHLAASTLPRQETIREDIERLLDRNRTIEAMRRAMRYVGLDFQLPADDPRKVPSNTWKDLWLNQVVNGIPKLSEDGKPTGESEPPYGGGYGAYHRLKVSEVTSEMAEVLARVLGIETDSDEVIAIRFILSAWRQVEFAADKPRGASSALPENAFLMNFDLSYRLRRLRFVIDRIETFMRAVEPLDAVPFDDNHYRVVPRRHQHADAILESTEHRGQAWSEVADADRDAARAWLRKLRGSLAGAQSVLRAAGRRLRKPGAGNPLAAEVERLGFEWDDLKRVLNASDDEGRIMAGRAVLGIPLEGGLSGEPSAKLKGVRALAKVIADELRKEFDRASSKVTMAFAPTELPEGSSVLTDQLRRCLWHHYRRFDYFDMVLFPMVAGTDVGELHEVDVLRISPEDAGSLIDERDPETHRRLRSKLAGTRLGNFGAFLDSIWRRSDILWGRLDGAERLIRGLYPLPHDGQPGREAHEACVDSMVRRAHGAIVSEELSGLAPETARRVFVEALLHSQTGDPEPKLLEHVLERLEGVIPDATVRVALKPADVQSTYDFAYRRLRELDRTKQLRLIARATTTFGKMLDGLSDRYAVLKDKRPVWWILTVGRMLWGMIEISAPRSLLELVARYWMNVLFALELLMLAGGILFHSAPVRDVALALLVVTAALDLCRRLLGAYLHYGGVRKFVAVMVALVLGLAIYGGKTLWPSVQEAVNTLVSQPNGVAIALAGVAAVFLVGGLLRFLLDRREARELKKFDREDARAAIT